MSSKVGLFISCVLGGAIWWMPTRAKPGLPDWPVSN